MHLFMMVAEKMTLSATLDFCAGISLMWCVINNTDSAFAFQGAVMSTFQNLLSGS